MKINLRNAFIVFVLVWIGAYFARTTGYYYTFWFTDVFLHTLSGVGFGFIFLTILREQKLNYLTLLISLASFAALGSVFWELWEFSGWHLVPTDMPFYAPELGDSLGDVVAGMIGGVITSIYLFIKGKKRYN